MAVRRYSNFVKQPFRRVDLKSEVRLLRHHFTEVDERKRREQ